MTIKLITKRSTRLTKLISIHYFLLIKLKQLTMRVNKSVDLYWMLVVKELSLLVKAKRLFIKMLAIVLHSAGMDIEVDV